MKSAEPDFIAATPAEDYGTFGAEHRFTPMDEIGDAGLRYLYGCWNELRCERDMPTRDELNPRSLGPVLRNVQMFEVLDGGQDFRCRVFGTGLAEVTGLQVTGRCMSQIEDVRLRDRMTSALRRVVETQAPVRMTGERAVIAHLAHKHVETIWLPMGGREGITHILSGAVFANRAA